MCSGVFAESDMNMDQYQVTIDELDRQIARLTIRRNGQEPGSALQLEFQRQLTEATTELLAWERQAPALAQCDAAIRDMAARVNHAQARLSDAARVGGRAAAMTGGAGLLLLVLSFVWLPTGWLPTVGVLLLAVAGLLWWITGRGRAGFSDELDRAQDMLAELTSNRAAQLPGAGLEDAHRVGSTRRVWEATRVDGLIVPGQVDAGGAGADGGHNPVGDGAARLLGGPAGELQHVVRQLNGDHARDDVTWGRR